MKTILLFSILMLSNLTGNSQTTIFEYLGGNKPTIKKEGIASATVIGEMMPNLWQGLVLPYRERIELDLILNYFPAEKYTTIVDLVSVEIVTINKGEENTRTSSSERLNSDQKEMLMSADLGSDILIRIKFKHKYSVNSNTGMDIRIGYYKVTLVPAVEATYPGGFQAFTNYITENVLNMNEFNDANSSQLPLSVNFNITENGAVSNIQIIRNSPATDFDNHILNAFKVMPKWNPAKDSNGKTVQQFFTIPFVAGC